MRSRRARRLKSLGRLVRPPFAERMQRFRQHPPRPHWWAMAAGAVALAGLVGWALI